jgi:cell division protein FtsZ
MALEEPGTFEMTQATFTFAGERRSPAKIAVIGIGGAGVNSINCMVEAKIKGVELIAANTDLQSLRTSIAPAKIEIGLRLTEGRGCGGNLELGRQAALDETERILELVEGCAMVFLIGGEGGGAFTGAAPVFARLASEVGALTIAMATMPFSFECKKRRANAEAGARELRELVDAIIAIPNESLLRTLDDNVSLEDSLRYIDNVFCRAVQDISEIVAMPGIINPDLADVRAVLRHKGAIAIGSGSAEGPNRAAEAVQLAISSPLLMGRSIAGAKAALVNIIGSKCNLKLHEIESAAGFIKEKAGLEDMILGAMYDDSMDQSLKVTVIATGLKQEAPLRLEKSGKQLMAACDAETYGPAGQFGYSDESSCESSEVDLDQPAFKRRRAG